MVFKRPAAAVFKRPAVPLVLPCFEQTLETPDWFDEPDEAAQNEVFLVTAAKGILKLGGVGGGKVLMWKTITGCWGGDKAAEMYTKVVLPALKAKYPAAKKYMILEDNDLVGNQSKKGLAAKSSAKMILFQIPKRSPDLNVLDFAIWREVEKRMRKLERNMGNRHETREHFERRLDRTAFVLEKEFIDKSIANLRERVWRLHEAKGGLFEEGGKARRPL